MEFAMDDLIEQLLSSARNGDVDQVKRIVRELLFKLEKGDILTPPQVFSSVDVLTAKLRLFELAADLAETCERACPDDQGVIRSIALRTTAQALIEERRWGGALTILKQAETENASDFERLSALGQQGRIHKERADWFKKFGPEAPNLQLEAQQACIKAYRKAYDGAKQWLSTPPQTLEEAKDAFDTGLARIWRWAGANLISRLPETDEACQKIADELAYGFTLKPFYVTCDPENHAVLGSAYWALGKKTESIQCYQEMLHREDCALGELERTHRDFKRHRDPDNPENAAVQKDLRNLLLGLKAQIAKRDVGRILLEKADVRQLLDASKDTELAKNWKLEWLSKGIVASTPVAGVYELDKLEAGPQGTGFLARAGDIYGEALPPELDNADTLIFITCNHLISSDNRRKSRLNDSESLHFKEVKARLKLHQTPDDDDVEFQFTHILFENLYEWDLCILLIEDSSKLKGLSPIELGKDWRNELPTGASDAAGYRPPGAYVVGHPQGNDLSVLLDSMLVASTEDRQSGGLKISKLHYRTRTFGGHSGSPVFNHDWQVVAMHQARDRLKKSGEGLTIESIKQAVQRK